MRLNKEYQIYGSLKMCTLDTESAMICRSSTHVVPGLKVELSTAAGLGIREMMERDIGPTYTARELCDSVMWFKTPGTIVKIKSS